jgi:tetratricopeptide (TPR) repeat protein
VQAKVETMQKEQAPDKLLARGQAFASVGDWTRAEQYLSAAMDAGADEREVMPLLLRVCMQDRRYRVAIAYAEEYERKHPNDAEMRFVLGTLYAAIGDVPHAREALEAVIAKQPDNAQAHYALASLLRDAHADPLAMDAHYREYLRLDPTGPHAEEARAALLKEVP